MPKATDTEAKRALRRARNRRFRKRQKLGLRRIAVDLPADLLDDVLIAAGFLAPELADDAEAVRRAAEKFTLEAIETRLAV